MKQRDVEQGPTIPLQVRVGGETRKKLKIIAAKNGLSLNAVAMLCLENGLSAVADGLRKIREPEKEPEKSKALAA